MSTAAAIHTETETLKDAFGVEFQQQVLALMYQDPTFLRMVAGIIEPEHFDHKTDATYAEIFLGFVKKFPKDTITKEVVFNEIGKLFKSKRIEEEDKPLYVKTFLTIANPIPAPEYVKEEIRTFVLSKSLEAELVGSVDLLHKGRHKEIIDRLTKVYAKIDIAEAASDIKVIGSIEERIEKLRDPEAGIIKDGISTGLPAVDGKLYRSGVGKGEMLVVCGSPGRGKSIWLANLTMAAILKGHNVLYYTLEMAADIVMARFDAMMTGVPFVDLTRHSEIVAERWNILRHGYKLGEIFLHDLPPRYLTPNMIRRHLHSYKERDIDISLLVVDYADIMASDKKIDERRLEHGDVYEQVRGIGKELLIAVATASQANRDSLRKKSVDIDSMAEDFSKAMTADYVMGLSQTKAEEVMTDPETGRGTGIQRAFFGKNRNGPKGVEAEFMTDFTKMRVSMLDMDRFDIEHFGKIIT